MDDKILVYKISRSEADPLDPALPDFDAITTELPAGLYTTFRTYGGRTKVLGLHSHLERLYLPAKAQGIVPTVRRPEDFRQILFQLLSRLDSPEARVRLILDSSEEPGTLFVLLQPLVVLPDEVYQNGVHVEISRSSREKPSLKRTTFINETTLERKRVGEDVFELLLTDKGRILEGMTSNFFYVREDALCTAGRGVLIGVTRQAVIALARREGLPFCIRALRVNELSSIREAFITSSSRGVVPVVAIDSYPVGDGSVGPVTRRLMKLYAEEVPILAEEIVPEIPKV
jgi:branched-chain amino acid aminotransferase